MKKTFLSLLCTFLFFACSQENLDTLPESKNDNTQKSEENIHVCTADFFEVPVQNPNLKAALLDGKKWDNGSVIDISFLNGSPVLHEKVMKYVLEWAEYINLDFRQQAVGRAQIKVAFKWKGDNTSWSYHGTDCKNIAQDQPSTNFGWLDENTSEAEFRRVVLHEFGHVLGLVHEHQHPTNNIQWNKEVVYSYYAQQGWNRTTVDSNIFKKYTTTQTNYNAYDKYSIMHYDIPAQHTLNNYSVGMNYVLSQNDVNFISQQYPIKTAKNALFYGKDRIKMGESKTSDNGIYTLTLESGGKLTLRKNKNTILWSINSGYNDVTEVSIYKSPTNFSLGFKTKSTSRGYTLVNICSLPYKRGEELFNVESLNLRIENNGNLVVDTGKEIVWKSNTAGK